MVNLLPIDEHAWKLDCILRTLDINDNDESWEHICSWLQMASNVEQVDLITEKFDASLAFCSSARHFENERSALLSKIATEITIFNFIWGAFESLINKLEPLIDGCNIGKYGKVKTARYIINKNQISLFPGYKGALDKLLQLYSSLKILPKHSHVKHNEKGIFLVYKIRNEFAHGAYSIPHHPDDFDLHNFDDTDLIRECSRIVLLTMQMILVSYFSDKNIELENLFLFDELDDIDTVILISLLRNVHVHGYTNLIS
ncbi:hypothetical protein [Bacillus sp. KH172YL63]|uniref:hypothetical protein n=1 Tax=Bacillus sp. KH172YL63 TaxID=2709784 RepID=UPI0013E4DFA6|nr:hypothetical protein [Bacillus sp. KH172YL63]BCB04787.1 hypothetical protein KH172YL63_29200 [Bacillus sp. KH172YL63]